MKGLKMDLRIERTRKCIKDAFIELRKRKPLEKITVKELSTLACINKATFYSHYNDIYDLSEQLENETISSILEKIPHIDCLISNPPLAIGELTSALVQNKKITDILFSGSRSGLYGIRLESAIKAQIFKQYPAYQDNLRWNMILTFLIQGGFHAYTSYQGTDVSEAEKILCELNTCINDYFLNQKDVL